MAFFLVFCVIFMKMPFEQTVGLTMIFDFSSIEFCIPTEKKITAAH